MTDCNKQSASQRLFSLGYPRSEIAFRFRRDAIFTALFASRARRIDLDPFIFAIDPQSFILNHRRNQPAPLGDESRFNNVMTASL